MVCEKEIEIIVEEVEVLKRYLKNSFISNGKDKNYCAFSYPCKSIREKSEVRKIERFISRTLQNNVTMS
jgi:hypothetical protein